MKATILLIGCLSLATLAASAQTAGPLAIGWHTIDGGGGPSAGGAFSLNGTIGQPDAGTMSGGAFTVSGGFWPGVTGGSVGPAPALSIRHGIGNTIVLTWPNPSTGYVLQQTASMSAPNGGWMDVTQPPIVAGGGMNKEVSLPATGNFCLFRLRRW